MNCHMSFGTDVEVVCFQGLEGHFSLFKLKVGLFFFFFCGEIMGLHS